MSKKELHTSCITDKPLTSFSDDYLEAETYASALYSFIVNADTPVTIGVQGGWGSGKTSLISVLEKQLDADEQHRTITVSVNAWEHSLFHEADDRANVAISLLSGMANGIDDRLHKVSADENEEGWLEHVDEIINKDNGIIDKAIAGIKFAWSLGSKIGLQMLVNRVFGQDKAPRIGLELTSDSNIPPIAKYVKELRTQLAAKISRIQHNNRQVKIVFFIDDLDRVQPATAIEILDITKNIFDIPNCIFVLAVDYDVVVKGLKEKYGDKTSENEREFRQYFDKIIQIPFTMPVGEYALKIINMLKPALRQLNYNNITDEVYDRLAEEAQLATGGNPRSIKRIINTLSLLKHISDAKSRNDSAEWQSDVDKENNFTELELTFIIVCLHIHYPEVCKCLMQRSSFIQWKFSDLECIWQLNKKDNDQDLKTLSNNTLFEHEWQQVLYCICSKSDWLKNRARNISQLMCNLSEVLVGKYELESEKSAWDIKKLVNIIGIGKSAGDYKDEIYKANMELLNSILASIRIVSLDVVHGETDQDIKNDIVTNFCRNLQNELVGIANSELNLTDSSGNKYFNEAVEEYAKRTSDGKRYYSMPIYSSDDFRQVDVKWFIKERTLEYTVICNIADEILKSCDTNVIISEFEQFDDIKYTMSDNILYAKKQVSNFSYNMFNNSNKELVNATNDVIVMLRSMKILHKKLMDTVN